MLTIDLRLVFGTLVQFFPVSSKKRIRVRPVEFLVLVKGRAERRLVLAIPRTGLFVALRPRTAPKTAPQSDGESPSNSPHVMCALRAIDCCIIGNI